MNNGRPIYRGEESLAIALEELIESCDWIEKNCIPMEKLTDTLLNAKLELSRYYERCEE